MSTKIAAATRTLGAVALLLALALSTLAAPMKGTRDTWRTVATEHFRVLSQLPDRETVAWAREFGQFIATMTSVLHIDARRLPPLTVVMFEDELDFIPYKPLQANGWPISSQGWFARRQTWSVIGLSRRADSDRQQRTIYHEATHWLMSVDRVRHPAWFAEGIAELLSTFEYREGRSSWAKPLEERLLLLRRQGLLPMRGFLTQLSPREQQDDNQTLRFYAQAWAFTHFLMFSGDPARLQLLQRFLEIYRTRSGEAAVDAVFGSQLATIEQEFRQYVSNPTFGYADVATTASSIAVSPPVRATPQQVETALGFLALGSSRDDLATQHANKAIKLDRAAPTGHEMLTYLAVKQKDYAAVAAHAREALKRGSTDSDMYMFLGHSLAKYPDAGQPGAARQRASVYERAIDMDPFRDEPYERLAEAIFNLQQPTAEDAQFLERGLTVFPGNDWIRVGSAVVAWKQGRSLEARQAMEQALAPESTLDDIQRQYAKRILQSLLTAPQIPN
jgi:hypothetical protein